MARVEPPPLPYAVDALERYYDARTVELHHGKHHLAYVNGLNAALEKLGAARAASDLALVKHFEREVAPHGGGRILCSVFWTNLPPATEVSPTGRSQMRSCAISGRSRRSTPRSAPPPTPWRGRAGARSRWIRRPAGSPSSRSRSTTTWCFPDGCRSSSSTSGSTPTTSSTRTGEPSGSTRRGSAS